MIPGYFDLQVNGYAGVDFNQDDLSAERLHHACAKMEEDGVCGFLATIVTDSIHIMENRLARLVALRQQDDLAKRLIAGLHIEGPFLNPGEGYRGAHPVDAIRPANRSDAERLLEAAGGLARIVTLAPEMDKDLAVTRWLAKQGVVVSAGHCNPSMDQLDAALDAGLSMYTHLGNGCPMMLNRHDNIIQRVLSRADRLWICFIADGVHVPGYALATYLQTAGDCAIVVSDAMPAAGLGPGKYTLGRWTVEVGEDLAAWAPNRAHLVGSAMNLPQMNEVLKRDCDLTATRRKALTSVNPRRALGLPFKIEEL